LTLNGAQQSAAERLPCMHRNDRLAFAAADHDMRPALADFDAPKTAEKAEEILARHTLLSSR
jgi:hypothetical protein